jgi:hypothetical protein
VQKLSQYLSPALAIGNFSISQTLQVCKRRAANNSSLEWNNIGQICEARFYFRSSGAFQLSENYCSKRDRLPNVMKYFIVFKLYLGLEMKEIAPSSLRI